MDDTLKHINEELTKMTEAWLTILRDNPLNDEVTESVLASLKTHLTWIEECMTNGLLICGRQLPNPFSIDGKYPIEVR